MREPLKLVNVDYLTHAYVTLLVIQAFTPILLTEDRCSALQGYVTYNSCHSDATHLEMQNPRSHPMGRTPFPGPKDFSDKH